MSHARRLIHITGCVIEGIPPEDCRCVIDDEDRTAYARAVPEVEAIHAKGGIVDFSGYDPE